MEDEEDVRSSPSPPRVTVASASLPEHSQPNGREEEQQHHPVTVAAPSQDALALAITLHQTKAAAAAAVSGPPAGGREDCWSEGETSVLIDAWGERYLELSRGSLKQKHWQEVADVVSSRDDYSKPPKTDVQCKNRIDTLKKKYKLEKAKIANGGGPSAWPFFRLLDDLIGPNPHNKSTPPPPAAHLQPPASATNNSSKFHHQFQQHLQGCKRKRSKKKSHRQLLQNLRIPAFSSPAPPLPESSDSFPPVPATANGKKRRAGETNQLHPPKPAGRRGGGGEGLRELTQAVLKFGEVYERVESSKLQQVVEMEKQRMGFTKELELQRMQFFMKTQLELTQLKRRSQKRRKEDDPAAAVAADVDHNNSNDDDDDDNNNSSSSNHTG